MLERVGRTDLFAVFDEESGRVHAIGYGASDDGKQVEDDRGLIRILEEQLLGDIDDDRQEKEGGE